MNDNNKHNMIDVVRPPRRRLEQETREAIARPIARPIVRAHVVPQPAPPRTPRPPLHKRAWALVRRHPWLAGIAAFFVVGNCITVLAPAIGTFLYHHPALKLQALIIACFWLLAIGTIPAIAMIRTVGNLAHKGVDALDGD